MAGAKTTSASNKNGTRMKAATIDEGASARRRWRTATVI
jgi:hypothetical protein